jgi:hypothetical protein
MRPPSQSSKNSSKQGTVKRNKPPAAKKMNPMISLTGGGQSNSRKFEHKLDVTK